MATYDNVIENWVMAMTTLQKSIRRVPQEIPSGAVFLGVDDMAHLS